MKSAFLLAVTSLLFVFFSNSLYAQTQNEVVVTATRVDQPLIDAPAAISVVDQDIIQLGRQQLGLDEALSRVPGLFFQNRYNYTQDLRIAVRGFGARANFGIRGIRIIADGIPATLADGQSGVDDIDMGSAQRIEVIRGPSSSLYGTASGGVISLFTEDGSEKPFVEARITAGEYNHEKYQLKAGGQTDNLNYFINTSQLNYGGYRDHSRVKHRLVNSKFRYTFDDSSELTVIINAVDSPRADDAGGITLSEVEVDRRQAQARNLSSNAGEQLQQQKFGLVYNKLFNSHHQITLRNYYQWRDFEAFLPIGTHIPFVADDGVVEFDRFFYGGGAQYTYTHTLLGRPFQSTTGFDIDAQDDDRQRFENNAGTKGMLTFDQQEEARSYGLYFRNQLQLSDTLELTLGGRYDKVELSVDDAFIANGDQSGTLRFEEFSAAVGLLWQATDTHAVYANYSTAFETPTFTELANPARNLNVNLGGFNNVSAQTADSFELGIKGYALNNAIFYDLAAYMMDVDDEIFSVENIGNRSFFENADTKRRGFEATTMINLTNALTLTASYTYSDLTFDNVPTDPGVEDNHLPGIPENQMFAELAYKHESGFFAVLDALYVDGFYADNSNTLEVDAYNVVNLRVGSAIALANLEVSPFIGINNLFEQDYFSNVRLNAFGGRAFEPAPKLNAFGGINARYHF